MSLEEPDIEPVARDELTQPTRASHMPHNLESQNVCALPEAGAQ